MRARDTEIRERTPRKVTGTSVHVLAERISNRVTGKKAVAVASAKRK